MNSDDLIEKKFNSKLEYALIMNSKDKIDYVRLEYIWIMSREDYDTIVAYKDPEGNFLLSLNVGDMNINPHGLLLGNKILINPQAKEPNLYPWIRGPEYLLVNSGDTFKIVKAKL